MTKTALWKVGIGMIAGALITGCATMGLAAGNRAQIKTLLGQWKSAFLAKDVNAMMKLYSEHYMANGRDKADETKEIAGDIKDASEDDAVVTVEDATITIRGKTADVAPITISGRTGSGTIRLTLAKEDGHWRIVKMGDK